MKTTLFALILGMAGALGLTTATETPASDGADRPQQVEKKKKKKKPQLDPGTNDGGGSVQRLVDCWCDGGANGNGPAQCQAADCDSADSCCVTAYGEGAEASDQ